MTLFDFTPAIRGIAAYQDTTRSNAKDMFLANIRNGADTYAGGLIEIRKLGFRTYPELQAILPELEASVAEWAEKNGAGAI